MKIRVLIFTPIIFAALLVGCVSGGAKFDETKVSQIKTGETTEADLVTLFGQPQNRMNNSDGKLILTWMYFEGNLKPQSVIPIVGPFMGGMNQKQKMLTVTLVGNKVATYSMSGTPSGPPPGVTAEK